MPGRPLSALGKGSGEMGENKGARENAKGGAILDLANDQEHFPTVRLATAAKVSVILFPRPIGQRTVALREMRARRPAR
jgi:hypothetical protein